MFSKLIKILAYVTLFFGFIEISNSVASKTNLISVKFYKIVDSQRLKFGSFKVKVF